MCGATPPNKAKIRGYLSLLQSWARFRFLVLRLRVNHLYTFSLITSRIRICGILLRIYRNLEKSV
ncbi:hypothetical protein Gotur_034258 [Gossypium turneri]